MGRIAFVVLVVIASAMAGCVGNAPTPVDDGNGGGDAGTGGTGGTGGAGNTTTGGTGGNRTNGGGNTTGNQTGGSTRPYHFEASDNITAPGYTKEYAVPVTATGKLLKAQLTGATTTPAGEQPLAVNITISILDAAGNTVGAGSIGPQQGNTVSIEVPAPPRGAYKARVDGTGADLQGVVTTKYSLVVDVTY